MMHQLTIDLIRCRGLHLCSSCEAVMPGLVQHCEQYGKVLISWPMTSEHSSTISRAVANCPDRAIMMKPMEEYQQ